MYHKKYEKHTNSNTKKKRFNLYLHIFYYTNKAFNAHSIAKVINKVLDIRTTNIKIIY